MIRHADWDERLAAYLADNERAVFEWGRKDCALFVADAVLVMTGEDIAAPFRGRYTTAMGATKALKRYGAGDLKSTFDTLLPIRPIGFARRGDVVMADGAVGICIGADALFIGQKEDQEGIFRLPRAEWSHAWGVGA